MSLESRPQSNLLFNQSEQHVLGVHRDGPDDIASHLDTRVEEDQEIALFHPSRNLYETCDLLENAEWSIPPSCVLTRSGSGARAEVRHEDAVHVGVQRGVGITFDSIDALSTWDHASSRSRTQKSSHERKAAEVASFQCSHSIPSVDYSRERMESAARRATWVLYPKADVNG